MLHNLLTGQRLLIVTEPGAQSSVVSGITTAANDAGATVTGQINLAAEVLRHQRHHAGQPEPDQPGRGPVRRYHAGHQRDLPAAGGAGDRQRDPATTSTGIGVVRVVAAASPPAAIGAPTRRRCSRPTPRPGSSAPPGSPPPPATLAIVVTPQNAPSDGTADPLDQVLSPWPQELAAKSSATVVAGSSAGSGAGSPIAVLRSNNVANQVSTVDDADLVSGQTVADPGARG